jgi:hypothetical protein
MVTTTTTTTTSCYFCGKEIHFDQNIKSERGKYIPLSGKTGTAKHRCSERPFNKYTRRQWWRSQRQEQAYQQYQQKKTTTVLYEKIKKHFVLLGLSPLCSSVDEVKQAYRKLALLYHPDRSSDASTTGKFIEIQEAYEKCLEELSAQRREEGD